MSTTHSMANEMLSLMRSKTTYLALLRSVPDKSGQGGDEVIESSYIRPLIAFTEPVDSTMRNAERVDFPTALTNWGTVAAYAVYDAQSGGTMLWSGALESPTPVPLGSHFMVAVEGLALSVGLT